MSGQIGRPLAWVALVGLVSVADLAMPAIPAHADDCRSTPNSPAPAGTYWHYRLDRPTQRKCWYVRALGHRAHQAAAPATPAHPIAVGTSSVGAKTGSRRRPDVGKPWRHQRALPRTKISAPKETHSPARGGAVDKTIRQGAQQERSALTLEAPLRAPHRKRELRWPRRSRWRRPIHRSRLLRLRPRNPLQSRPSLAWTRRRTKGRALPGAATRPTMPRCR